MTYCIVTVIAFAVSRHAFSVSVSASSASSSRATHHRRDLNGREDRPPRPRYARPLRVGDRVRLHETLPSRRVEDRVQPGQVPAQRSRSERRLPAPLRRDVGVDVGRRDVGKPRRAEPRDQMMLDHRPVVGPRRPAMLAGVRVGVEPLAGERLEAHRLRPKRSPAWQAGFRLIRTGTSYRLSRTNRDRVHARRSGVGDAGVPPVLKLAHRPAPAAPLLASSRGYWLSRVGQRQGCE